MWQNQHYPLLTLAPGQPGPRVIIVDCPTVAHFAELSRPHSPAGAALAALTNEAPALEEGGEGGNLAAVVHLAPEAAGGPSLL